MNYNDLTTLKDMLSRATPPPWGESWLWAALRHADKSGHVDPDDVPDDENTPGFRDAGAIAALWNAAPALLDRLAACDAEIVRLRAAVMELHRRVYIPPDCACDGCLIICAALHTEGESV